jgi:hypothetical protein
MVPCPTQAMIVQERNDLTQFIPDEKKKSKRKLVEERRNKLWQALLGEKDKLAEVMRGKQEVEEAKAASRQAALAEARLLKRAAVEAKQETMRSGLHTVLEPEPEPEPEPEVASVVAAEANETLSEESARVRAEVQRRVAAEEERIVAQEERERERAQDREQEQALRSATEAEEVAAATAALEAAEAESMQRALEQELAERAAAEELIAVRRCSIW